MNWIMTWHAFKERTFVRFGTTLTANVICRIAGFFSNILIARGLGVASFGDLSFLVASFAAILALIDMGSSSAFFTFLSRKLRSARFLWTYLLWLCVQLFGFILALGWLLPDSWISKIWLGHDRINVMLAFVASFFIGQAWGSVSQLGEARRKTAWVQTFEVIQSVAHLILLSVAWHYGWITLRVVLCFWIFEYASISLALAPRLVAHNLNPAESSLESTASIVKDYWSYCRPLALMGLFVFVYRFADRWLLQRFAGSAQQGYYSIAIQFANVCLIATASIMKIFWKEIAQAHHDHDQARVQRLYKQISRGLYAFSAWCCCILIPYAAPILQLTVGAAYVGGALTFALYLLYPIHNSLGQIEGTFLQAVGDTKNLTKLSIAMMLISLPVTYFLLADHTTTIPGLGLGAVGLTFKMVFLQIISVNLAALIIARTNRWKFQEMYQVKILGFFLVLAWVCRYASEFVFVRVHPGHLLIIQIAAGVLFYVSLSALAVYYRPGLLGFELAQMKRMLADLSYSMRAKTEARPAHAR